MYRALKSAQVDMNEMLLKFADDVTEAVRTVECKSPSDSRDVGLIENSIASMINQQNIYFTHITTTLQNIDLTMKNILNAVNNQATQKVSSVTMSDMIPSIQPTASNMDLKDICIAGDISNVDHELDGIDTDIQQEEIDGDLGEAQDEADDEGEADEDEAEEAEAQEELELEEADEEVEEADEEVEEEAEEELEVEEWSYKGKLFFKDTENTVYINDGGELGDPVGLYDPIKKIVKKLVTQ